MMPGIPAREVIDQIKDVKIILFSAVSMSEAEEKTLLKTGTVVDYLKKPFDIKTLFSKVKKALGN